MQDRDRAPYGLRPAGPDDAAFLYALHAASMRDAIEATWGWDEAWQRAHFADRFSPDDTAIIICGSTPVGMLEVEDRADALHVANLKISPGWQRRGIGTAVMRDVLARAAVRGVPVTLQVLQANPGARRLYERLGFQRTAETPPHVQMRHPGRGSGAG